MESQYYVRSDLYSAGRDMDGDEYIAEVYLLVKDGVNGTRSIHTDTFKGAETWDDGGGCYGWADVRDEAYATAIARLAEVKDTDEGWYESEPVYGTDAWLQWEQNN